ncbi:hypothetical protein BN1723_019099, partial [Verticillium longisporum]
KQPRDPYPYSQASTPADHQQQQHHAYYRNGSHASPGPTTYSPRSPVSHAHVAPPLAGSISPSIRPPPLHMTSPNARRAASPAAHHASSNGASHVVPPMAKSDVSPLKAPAAAPASTPSRADPMSFSNILSSSEPVAKPRAPSPPPAAVIDERAHEPKAEVETETEPERNDRAMMDIDTEVEAEPEFDEPTPKIHIAKGKSRDSTPTVKEKKAKVPRKSKSRASDIRDAESTPKTSRRASSARETPTPRVPVKRQANGQPKQKVLSADKEKKVQAQIAKLDAETDDVDDTELDDEHRGFLQRGQKRRRIMQNLEAQHNDRRRTHGSEKIV